MGIGGDEPSEGGESDDRIEREKAALAELLAQIAAQPRARQDDMAAMEDDARDEQRGEGSRHRSGAVPHQAAPERPAVRSARQAARCGSNVSGLPATRIVLRRSAAPETIVRSDFAS